MENMNDVTYTLIFGILLDKNVKLKSITLSHVWDLKNGQIESSFIPSDTLIKSAEKQFREMDWGVENGNEPSREETGYCYYFESNPNEVVCSNDLRR